MTAAPDANPAPLIVIFVPPTVVPLLGEMPVTETEEGLVDDPPHADTNSAAAGINASLLKEFC